MDLAILVRHLTQALGTDATPDRVERVAVSLLDSGVLVPLQSAADTRALVLAAGAEAGTLLHAVSGAVAQAGGRVLDVSQQVDPHGFTLSMLVDTAHVPDAFTGLRRALEPLAEQHSAVLQVQLPVLAHVLQGR